MFSNPYAALDKPDDHDADGFQIVGEGRRRRNNLANQDPSRSGSPGAPVGGARNRNAAPNARHRAGRPPQNAASHGPMHVSRSAARADLGPVKVELCKNFAIGRCTRGGQCPFAHGEHELGHLNPRAAVQLTHWVNSTNAPAQHVRALAVSPEPTPEDCKKYKRRICAFFEEGTCDQGSLCSFAHGQAELRRKGDPVPSIDYLRSLYTGAKPPDNEWFPDPRRPALPASFQAGEFPSLGNGDGYHAFGHAPRPPAPPGPGRFAARNGTQTRGPNVAPPSDGTQNDDASWGPAPNGYEQADEQAQLAAALAAVELGEGPARQPHVDVTPTGPQDTKDKAAEDAAPAPPRRPAAYNPLIAARRKPAVPPAQPPPPPGPPPPAAVPLNQAVQQQSHQEPAPAAPVQPPLVFGKFDPLSDDEDEYPNAFMCPITHDLMEDPVVAADGVTYERRVIEDWFTRSSDSPLMGMRLEAKHLIPNVALQTAIRRDYPERFPALS